MSLKINDTTNKNGIMQIIERNCGFNDGDITGNTTLFAQFMGDVNLAMDKVLSLILQASGTWDFDDNNQTDYPIITTNLVSGQRDYSFTLDGSSNIVLEIKAVYARVSSTGIYQKLDPIDVPTDELLETQSFTTGQNIVGVPSRYDKLANGIFLDPVPNFSSSDGLKVYISRETTYFTVTDTTKKPGFAGIFHEYLALRPSYQYCYRNSRVNTSALQQEMLTMEKAIQEYYGKRERDDVKNLSESSFNFR